MILNGSNLELKRSLKQLDFQDKKGNHMVAGGLLTNSCPLQIISILENSKQHPFHMLLNFCGANLTEIHLEFVMDQTKEGY